MLSLLIGISIAGAGLFKENYLRILLREVEGIARNTSGCCGPYPTNTPAS
jgi:hypothetical protein